MDELKIFEYLRICVCPDTINQIITELEESIKLCNVIGLFYASCSEDSKQIEKEIKDIINSLKEGTWNKY